MSRKTYHFQVSFESEELGPGLRAIAALDHSLDSLRRAIMEAMPDISWSKSIRIKDITDFVLEEEELKIEKKK